MIYLFVCLTAVPCPAFNVENSQSPNYTGYVGDSVMVNCSLGYSMKGVAAIVTQFVNHCNGSALWDNTQECSRE